MRIALVILLACLIVPASGQEASHDAREVAGWPEHGGDPGGARFSTLDKINRDNVQDLEVAWRYRTGDGEGPIEDVVSYGLQGTPILLTAEAGGFLVLCSAFDEVVALNPANGDVASSG